MPLDRRNFLPVWPGRDPWLWYLPPAGRAERTETLAGEKIKEGKQ